MGTRFNCAVDWLDAVARGNERPAVVIVEEDGSSTQRSFASGVTTGSRPSATHATFAHTVFQPHVGGGRK